MRTQTIDFQDQQTLCAFPKDRTELEQAVSELGLNSHSRVIVLIGGGFEAAQADLIRRAIVCIAGVAEEQNAIVICGGTDMGVMAEIGQVRLQKKFKFPLLGIAPEQLVTWPGGPHSGKFLGWGEKRWQIEPHYSHFILVPGDEFGDESSWIIDAATMLSKDHLSVTILIGGGEVSAKDIDLSLAMGRPVLALSRTGRLADELARQPNRHKLIAVIPANAEQRIAEAVQVALSGPAQNQVVEEL